MKRKNRNNAWNESCRFHNGLLFSANWTVEPEGARHPGMLSRPFEAAPANELGMTELAEKGSPFQRASSVGQGGGVGRALGNGLERGDGVGLGVGVGVGVDVGIGVIVGVDVAVGVGVSVGVGVAVTVAQRP